MVQRKEHLGWRCEKTETSGREKMKTDTDAASDLTRYGTVLISPQTPWIHLILLDYQQKFEVTSDLTNMLCY